MLRHKKLGERTKPGHGESSRTKDRKSSSRGLGAEDSATKYSILDSGAGGSREKSSSKRENESLKRQLCSPMLGLSTSSDEDLDNDLRQGIDNIMKLREEYDKLEGALKKLGVDPECVVTEEEDGYNAESDLEEDTEQDCDRGETTTFIPAVYTVDASHRGLARVDEDVDSLLCSGSALTGGDTEDTGRVTASCPSSPTETECSSGFSTLRRRSVNVTEKVRQNRDGSKIQVVRESAVATSSSKEPTQSVTFQQNSFVYINGSPEPGSVGLGSSGGAGSVETGHHDAFQSRSSDIFVPSSCQPFNTSLVPSSSAAAVPETNLYGGSGSSKEPPQSSSSYRGHIVRLNSIEPNTVMFSTKDYPILSDVTMPEIIDELERQFDAKLCEVQGVRQAGSKVFICLSQRESLAHLAQYGFYVRGVHVTVMDISNDSVVVCLIGVPHYITDSTITMLVSTFGICIGEVERRYYKGVDTGERYVRLKPKGTTQIPDYVTVGGCKILIKVLTQDDVGAPFTLHSMSSRSEPSVTGLSNDLRGASATSAESASIASGLALSGSGCSQPLGPNFRAKPGHCNGSLNSPHSDMPPSLPPLTLSGIPSASLMLSPPPPPPRNGADSAASSISLPSSPKIARSFRSRISVTLRSPPTNGDNDKNSYVPGESVDGIPALSPPSYRTPPGITGNGSALCIGNGKGTLDGLSSTARPSSSSMDDPSLGTSSTLKRSNRESPSASSLRKYAIQNNNMHKTESNLSVNSMDRLGGSISDTASKDLSSTKRTSVVFEEPKSGNFVPGGGSTLLSHNRQISTSKTVNGILRKGSLRGNDTETDRDLPTSSSSSRKTRKAGDHRHHRSDRSHSGSSSKTNSKHRSSKHGDGDSEDHGDGGTRSSRSRSNSTKSSAKGDKREQNNLALTRDLPWCGCWGNGCL